MERYSTPDIAQSPVAHAGGSADVAKPASASLPLTGGVMAGLAASLCCIGPLVLVALGAGAAAAGLIEFFTPLRPVFIGLALLFLGFAGYRLFFVPRACAAGTLRNQRLLFLGIAIVTAALVAFPWYVGM